MTEGMDLLIAGLAAVFAGAVNALAGGGTLITFPVLLLIGVPPLSANITNTVALCPGYLGATLAQTGDLGGQKKRLFLMLPVGLTGGAVGATLLLMTTEELFQALVPYLILTASLLVAIQEPVRKRLARRPEAETRAPGIWSMVPIGLAAVYGGYFGAGLSVIVLAALALTLDDSLTRLNASKQAIALSANIAAAVYFLFSGRVLWLTALIMAAGALAGGFLGGRLAGSIKASTLRRIVVAIGITVAVIYFRT
ncbi:MAG: sulfite exporter TauE/SafE family protein [Acidobacteria bacterium]|nr:sulfite exporter TauE/SafE family protein [Acidobacteriota bacterium]